MKNTELVTVARLMKPHGVKGDIKTEPLTHSPQRLKKLDRVVLEFPDGRQIEAKVTSATAHGPVWYLRIEGYETPEAGAALNNALVQIPLEERIPLPEGQYYPSDLEGLTVIDEKGKARGKVLSLIEFPSVSSFEIKIGTHIVLAPWIDACIGKIDLTARTVEVNLEFLAEVHPEIQNAG
jgi:16S rRNA processing protein RimM